MSTTVEVWVEGASGPRLVGRAFFTRSNRGVSTTFTYDSGYLADDGSNIDPFLTLVAGPQHFQGLLPAFADSAPDRWGRNLIEKKERASAREQDRRPRALDDVDFLLGVSDETRQGALRFRVPGGGRFYGDRANVPALISLPRLLAASRLITTGDDPVAAVKELLDTGTAGLGGARPKASVSMNDGSLAIAKFPHNSDQWDVMAWEATALDLLDVVGIRTPQRELIKVGGSSVLVLRRFDRTGSGLRIGYISAMTATNSRDGHVSDYVDIATAMRDLSYDLPADHRELFDRVIGSVALGNTDDHLRNHGFLAHGNLWSLSPVFDVNPTTDESKSRASSIAGADAPADEVDGLFALAAVCGLDQTEARDRMGRIAVGLRDWSDYARANGVSKREIATMGESIGPRLQNVASGAVSGRSL